MVNKPPPKGLIDNHCAAEMGSNVLQGCQWDIVSFTTHSHPNVLTQIWPWVSLV